MIVLESCCFCIPLRVGCLILAYLNLIGDILIFITSIMSLVAGIALSASSNEHNKDMGAALLGISIVILIFVLILLTFTIVLLVGLHKEKRGHVKAYLIYALIFLIIYIILFIVRCSTTAIQVGDIIGTIIEILLYAYFLLVFRSHYVKMGETNFNSA